MYKTHNLSYTKIYKIWYSIKNRCNNPKHHAYKDYGGRGIKICYEWQNSLVEFEKYMGKRPSEKHSVDRINPDGNYEPGNVKWSSPYEQANNRRDNIKLSYNGKTQTITQWATELNIKPATIASRKHNGWTDEEILTIPIKNNVILSFNGEEKTLAEWARITGINIQTLSRRVIDGWPTKDILSKPKTKIIIELQSKLYTITEFSTLTGIKYKTIDRRIKQGLSAEDILKLYNIKISSIELDLSTATKKV